MNQQKLMNAQDTISGRLGRALATVDGNIEEMMYLKNIEAKMERIKKDIAILGKPSSESKVTGIKYTGTATIRYVTSYYRKMLLRYAKEGIDTYFNILIENEDPSSKAGKQAILLKGVNLDGGIIARLDLDSDDALNEDISFTFSDWDILEEFKPL